MSANDRPHTWTLPLAPYRWGYLELPSRNVTEAEWDQLHVLLDVFKSRLVRDDEPGDPPIAETLAALSVDENGAG